VPNGEPDTWESAPVVWSTENTDTLLGISFVVASSPPPGLNASELGLRPVANGEPDTCVSAPVV
jgi:hypothetical protein